MEIVIDRADRLAVTAADVFERVLCSTTSVLGLATGSTPLPVYGELVRRHREEGLSFAAAQAFLLDEYVGLPPGHPECYVEVIRREFTDKIDIQTDAVHVPDGRAPDLVEACKRYERDIAIAGGVDIQILGVGSDGHIAFNEPGSSMTSRTRIKTLTEQTRRDNARFFGGDPEAVPRHALTQGLGTIMEARHIVVIAAGGHKAEAVRNMVEGAVSARWPATVLQFHPHVTALLDEAAASKLDLRQYYQQARLTKPAWQLH